MAASNRADASDKVITNFDRLHPFFLAFTSRHYWERVQAKLTEDQKKKNQQPDHNDLKFHERAEFKFHVSLAQTEYLKHVDAICDILIKYVENGTIDTFKIVNKTAFGYSKNRFKTGEQFSIYTPANYDKVKLLQMLKEINQYIAFNKISAGTHSATTSTLTNHISCRQEYVPDGDSWRRIAADTTDQDQITSIVAAQENSDFFQFLSLNFPEHFTQTPKLLANCNVTIFSDYRKTPSNSASAQASKEENDDRIINGWTLT